MYITWCTQARAWEIVLNISTLFYKVDTRAWSRNTRDHTYPLALLTLRVRVRTYLVGVRPTAAQRVRTCASVRSISTRKGSTWSRSLFIILSRRTFLYEQFLCQCKNVRKTCSLIYSWRHHVLLLCLLWVENPRVSPSVWNPGGYAEGRGFERTSIQLYV